MALLQPEDHFTDRQPLRDLGRAAGADRDEVRRNAKRVRTGGGRHGEAHLSVADVHQFGDWLTEPVRQMIEEGPVAVVTERVALDLKELDRQRIAWFGAGDVDRSGDGVAVIA